MQPAPAPDQHPIEIEVGDYVATTIGISDGIVRIPAVIIGVVVERSPYGTVGVLFGDYTERALWLRPEWLTRLAFEDADELIGQSLVDLMRAAGEVHIIRESPVPDYAGFMPGYNAKASGSRN